MSGALENQHSSSNTLPKARRVGVATSLATLSGSNPSLLREVQNKSVVSASSSEPNLAQGLRNVGGTLRSPITLEHMSIAQL